VTRRLLPAALALTVVASACGDAPAPPTLTAPPAPPPAKTAEQRVAFYQDCWRLYNEKNYDAFGKCYSETATSEAVDSAPAMVRGRTAVIDDRKARDAMFSDRRGDPVLVLANGARIASVVVYSATNDGPMPTPDGKAMPATKKRFSEYIAHTVELDSTGSMAIADASYLDEGTMLAQLGVIKTPARKPVTPPGTPPTVVVARNDATETGNIAAFRATVDAINKRDTKTFAAMLADDYRAIDVTMAKDQNRKEALAGMAAYQKAFSDMALNVANVWAAGDYVVATGTFTGTNTGPMPTMGLMKKTDRKINVRFIEIVKFANGKAQEDWTFYNGAAFASQLGLK
jgi:predicted ester cyclase